MKSMKNLVLASYVLAILLFADSSVRGQMPIRYQIEDLGAVRPHPSALSTASGINAEGQVSGYAMTSSLNDSYVPYRFTTSGMQNLGNLNGGTMSLEFGSAGGINNNGQITGYSLTANGRFHAFLASGNSLIDLGGGSAPEFPSGQDQTIGRGINNLGDVVGTQGTGTAVGFYYNGSTLLNINNLLPPNSGWQIISATGINDSRQIVGQGIRNGIQRAYRFNLATGEIIDLGVIGANGTSNARGINALGQVVGTSNSRGFRYTDGQGIIELAPLASHTVSNAIAINNAGFAVGLSQSSALSTPRAVLWSRNGAVQDLNSLIDQNAGWTLQSAVGINELGQITGVGIHVDAPGVFQARAYRLTPVFPENRTGDFDGDGYTDFAVFRPANGFWFAQGNLNSGFRFAQQFGVSTDRLAPGDYDGDGRTDLAVFRNGNWFIWRSFDNTLAAFQFGLPDDIPVAADFDGDNKTDLAIWRRSNGLWAALKSGSNGNSSLIIYSFGASGDKPVVGDYDGDNRADFAVFRPSNGTWYLQQTTEGFRAMQFGVSTDRPVQADYDGDNRTDIVVFRPDNGTWYLQQSAAGFSAVSFGLDSDKLVPGDYNGDGKTDIAVFRDGIWYLRIPEFGGLRSVQYGSSGDIPIPAAYVQ